MKKLFCVLIIILGLTSCANTDNEVSMSSLLVEMGNRNSVAEYPELYFRLMQESSYNRASKTPADSIGWFRNNDFNNKPGDKNFVRVDTVDGKPEWVLMDHKGPGSIVRTWMPFPKSNKSETDAIIKVYLDGSTVPVIEGNMLEVFNGDGLIPYPFAHKSLRSAVSFFPIPYSKSCKVTTSEAPYFYQITYREYSADTRVKTFTMQDFTDNKDLIDKVGDELLASDADKLLNSQKTINKRISLDADEKSSMELNSHNSAIYCLKIKMNPDLLRNSTALRNLLLNISFDGMETVNSTFSDFFGCGVLLNPYQDRYKEILETGEFVSKWVMPFQSVSNVSVINKTGKKLDMDLSVAYHDYPWTKNTMYFHATSRLQKEVPTRPYSDWNYITVKGKGVYVGDALTVFNPVKRWWGEGDEKIWVDDDKFPSIFGTGTEDYYGYSWGGVSTDFYEHPFHAQPASNKYNKLNRKNNIKEKNTQGYNTEVRVRALDGIPFNESLKLDMEVWSWTDCVMEYSVGTCWYMLP